MKFFLTALSRKPQTLEALCEKILPQFKGVDRETILRDAKDFYDTLVEDGFLVKGETEAELNARDNGFSYKSFDPKTIKKDFSPAIKRADTDTQAFLEEHFKNKPHLTSLKKWRH